MNKSILALFLLMLAVSCQTHEKQPLEKEAISLNGNWEYLGFGRGMTFGDTIIKRYHMTSVGHVPLSDNTPKEFFDYYTVDTLAADTILIRDGVKAFKLFRTDTDFAKDVHANKAEDPRYNFEVLWHTFNEQYCYFTERNIDWDAMYQTYQPQVNSDTTPLELYLLFEKMLGEIGDGHISMDVPDELEEDYEKQLTATEGPMEEEVPAELEKQVKRQMIDRYVEEVKEFNRGDFKWGRINEDIGYLQFSNMIGFAHYDISDSLSTKEFWNEWWQKLGEAKNYHDDTWKGTRYLMDSIAKTLGDAEAIIVDLRFNGGGFDEVSVETLNHFAQERTDFCTKKARLGDGYTEKQTMTLLPAEQLFKGKLYVLISHETASAAELLTLGSKAIPNATLIGSTTEGVFSDVLHKKLPNGWTYGLSNLVYESMEGISYENVGIAPDVAMAYPKGSKDFYEYLLTDLKDGDDAIEYVIAQTKK